MNDIDYFAAHAPIGPADARDLFYNQYMRNATVAELLPLIARLRYDYAKAMIEARPAKVRGIAGLVDGDANG